jgi:hypothetical protein
LITFIYTVKYHYCPASSSFIRERLIAVTRKAAQPKAETDAGLPNDFFMLMRNRRSGVFSDKLAISIDNFWCRIRNAGLVPVFFLTPVSKRYCSAGDFEILMVAFAILI